MNGGTFNTSSVVATSRANPQGAGIELAGPGHDSVHVACAHAQSVQRPGQSGGHPVSCSQHWQARRSGLLPTGVAKVNLFYDGANHTVATAPYNGRRNVWFDVRVDVQPGNVAVAVDGVELFDACRRLPLHRRRRGAGHALGAGQSSTIWYEPNSIFHPLTQTFAGPLPTGWAISGAWEHERWHAQRHLRIANRHRGNVLRLLGYRHRILLQAAQPVRASGNSSASSTTTSLDRPVDHGEPVCRTLRRRLLRGRVRADGPGVHDKVLNGRSYRVR